MGAEHPVKYVLAVTQGGDTTYYGPMDEAEAKGAAAEYGTFYTGRAAVWPLDPKAPGR